MPVIWKECAACHSPTLPADLTRRTPQGMAHEHCDEPTWQKCTGCSTPVHLNHVEYDDGDTDQNDRCRPWCPQCFPVRPMAPIPGRTIVIACGEHPGTNELLLVGLPEPLVTDLVPEHTASVVRVLEVLGYHVLNGGSDKS